MASIENRSRYTVTVKNRDDLTQEFPFNKSKAIQAYIVKLREQGFKPKLSQAENLFLVRIRQKGYDEDQVMRNSREEADAYIKKIEEERHRGLFIDYTAAHKTSFASLLVRYLEEEVPKLKSSRYLTTIKVEGWLEDSGPEGVKLLEAYREGLAAKNVARRPAKHKMREVSTCLAWIHKRLSEVTTSDIEDYSAERLLSVMPATVDREFDILRAIFTVLTKIWDFNLAKNPLDAARRPQYFNERDRRIPPEEERRLIDALAAIDRERAVKAELARLVNSAVQEMEFTSTSARKKVCASEAKRLRARAEQECEPVPLLETFAHFQLMTAARRSESLNLTWDRIDFEAGTAFLPETKNGRPRKLSLRKELVEMLGELPRTSECVFPMSVKYLSGMWNQACETAELADLHIHDCRHEGISRAAETGQFTLIDLQQFSGHRDTRMLMRYAHLCASKLARKLDTAFKDEHTHRVHRGRKYLSKNADITLGDVVAEGSKVASLISDEEARAVETLIRNSTCSTSPSQQKGNVIPFPNRRAA